MKIELKAKIPNPKEPFKVDPKQLSDLDSELLKRFPDVKLTEGCRFARWAEFDVGCLFVRSPMVDSIYDFNFEIFRGRIFGREKTILMFLPFFD